MKEEFQIWQVWKRSGVPLNEIRYEWTYVDLLKASALLDMYDDYEVAFSQYDTEQMERNNKRSK